jgi:SAM-dependent methyltransferase
VAGDPRTPGASLARGVTGAAAGDGGAPGGTDPRAHPGGYDGARTTIVRDVLNDVVRGLVAQTGRARLDIVDAGGGTGGFAVPLASMGHNVTVVDPSPDSLAAARRRAAEVNVALPAVQGDAADLPLVAGEQSADLVLCHSVLEYVDSPALAMAGIARVLRPGGAVSVLAASAVAAVIHRALAGRFEQARKLLAAIGQGDGQPAHGAAPGAARMRRFTLAGVTGLIEEAGLRPGSAHGVAVFAGLVPGIVTDADPGAAQGLLALEWAVSAHPAFHDFAAQFHVLGYR